VQHIRCHPVIPNRNQRAAAAGDFVADFAVAAGIYPDSQIPIRYRTWLSSAGYVFQTEGSNVFFVLCFTLSHTHPQFFFEHKEKVNILYNKYFFCHTVLRFYELRNLILTLKLFFYCKNFDLVRK